MQEIDGELGTDFNFFPLTAVHIGKWLSAFHIENQLFLYVHNPTTLVLLAVHPRDTSHVCSPYMIPYIRQRVLKNFGRNSPFAKPIEQMHIGKQPTILELLRVFAAEFTGVTAFELHFEDILALDYMNTLVTYGSRIVFEMRKIKKL